MSTSYSFYLVRAFAALVGATCGMLLHSTWKRVQREEGQRQGFVKSRSTKFLCGFVGLLLGSLCASLAQWNTIHDVLSSATFIWFPVLLEAIFAVTKTHIVSSMIRKNHTANKDTLAMNHAKLYDRFKYSMNVVNVLLTAYILGKCPEKMYLFYTFKMLLLYPIRFIEFRKQRLSLYNLELCLFVNYFCLIYLYTPDDVFEQYFHWLAPSREVLFASLFGLANGPVGWYLIAFDGTLSFFDRGRTTSAFIHFAPPLLTYCIRWYSDHTVFPIPSETSLLVPQASRFYFTWVAFQYTIVLGFFYSKIKSDNLLCLFMEPHFEPVRNFSTSHKMNRLMYFLLHATLTTSVIVLTPLLYTNENVHFGYLVGLAAFSIWNGSAETFERFKESYDEELKARLKIVTQEDQAVDPVLIKKISSIVCEVGGPKVTLDTIAEGSITDIGFDSMRVGLLTSKLQEEYKIGDLEVTEIMTKSVVQIAKLVNDRAGKGSTTIKPCPAGFTIQVNRPPVQLGKGETLAEIFLNTCDRMKGFAAVADDSKPGGNILDYSRVKIAALLVAQYINDQEDLSDCERIGVMLPASVGASVVTFGALIAGKTPVMINFTMGADNISYCRTDAKAKKIITSAKFIATLRSKGVELPTDLGDDFIFAEDLMSSFTTLDKIFTGLIEARRTPKKILDSFGNKRTVDSHAVILFTSGSTSRPKGVPLTNKNIIENLKGVLDRGGFTPQDVLMAALPPFHSFGFAATTITPLIFGVRCVYYPNPTAFGDIARQMARWKPTVYFSTPTWMEKIYGAAANHAEWLTSLRTVIVGAEACSQSLKDLCKEKKVNILEGYGITETSPVVATTMLGEANAVGVGYPVEGVEVIVAQLVDPDEAVRINAAAPASPRSHKTLLSKPDLQNAVTARQEKVEALRQLEKAGKGDDVEAHRLRCQIARKLVSREISANEKGPDGEHVLGNILVCGPNVFGDTENEAYLNHNVYELVGDEYKFDPFIFHKGKMWYNTEDLGRFAATTSTATSTKSSSAVTQRALIIEGRLKRFVKKGGEMISLGAIEAPLGNVFKEIDDKKTFAVESTTINTPDEGPQPFIAALVDKEAVSSREEAKKLIKKALAAKFASGAALNLHLPDDVFLVDRIPMLGTGKLDLQGCKKMVAEYATATK